MADTAEKVKAALEPRTFKVSGMTCNACVNSVERSLNSMPGVSATVNFAAETAHVLAPAEITGKEIIKQIEAAGYKGKEIGDNEAITLHSKNFHHTHRAFLNGDGLTDAIWKLAGRSG
jgi:Cu+-exporting ATPase